MNIDFNTPVSLDCQNYIDSYPSARHVIMGNLKVIPDSRIIIFLKTLNKDFPLILISLYVVERLLLH